jgi:hypothetical protein
MKTDAGVAEFQVNDGYRLRRAAGTASGGGPDALTDADQDFEQLGVGPGDVVYHLGDQSFGAVSARPTATQLEFGEPAGGVSDSLFGGDTGAFAGGDGYQPSRFVPRGPHTGVGLLPIHLLGVPYRTDWSLEARPDATDWGGETSVCSNIADQTERDKHAAALVDARVDFLGLLGGGPPPELENGMCRWLGVYAVDCVGIWTPSSPSFSTPPGVSSVSACPSGPAGTPTRRRVVVHVQLGRKGMTLLDPITLDERRTRTLCVNYSGTDCTTEDPGEIPTAHFAGGASFVSVEDYDASNNLVGRARLRFTTANPGQGALRVSGIETFLFTRAERNVPDAWRRDALPPWFLRHGWHRVVAYAVAESEQPQQAGDCGGAPADCLSVAMEAGAAASDWCESVEAVVLATGPAGDTSTGTQNRSTGGGSCAAQPAGPCEWLEDENGDGDDRYVHKNRSPTFNDQVRAICVDDASAGACRGAQEAACIP